jgi:hypothetical protein
MFSKLHSLKYNMTTIYNNSATYSLSAITSVVKNTIIATSTIAAKIAIHVTRSAFDVAKDIGNIMINTFSSRTPEEKIVNNHNEEVSEILTNDSSYYKKAKAFIQDTWNEQDDSYLDGISKALGEGNQPLAKLVIDLTILPYKVIHSSIIEVAKVAIQANNDGLSAAYKEGAKYQENTAMQACIVEEDTEEDDVLVSFNQDKLAFDYDNASITSTLGDFIAIEDNSDMIELSMIGDIAPAA